VVRVPRLKPPSPATLATLAIVACTAVAINVTRPLATAAVAILGITVWFVLTRLERHAVTAEARRVEAARQLDRRISELFSLQELSYVLAESIELDRIADQVARYGARFLQADGALVALVDEDGDGLRVAAAVGVLAPFQDRAIAAGDPGLVRLALARERIEVAQAVDQASVLLVEGEKVRSAAVAPLRSQGRPVGALAVADRREGPFTTEDLWLLSTIATQTSMAVANSRLYEMVRRSTEEWETAFDALSEGLGVVGAAGQIVRANRALAQLAGMPVETLVGADFAAAVAESAPLAGELLASAQRLERPGTVELRRERDGRRLRLTAAPLWGPGAEASVVILVEDVTEQRAMEAQLIQNEKMASIGQLVSGVAHELNNPLTSIAGLAELLLEPAMRVPEPTREHLRVIHDQAERAARIVRNLLTFARPSSLAKEPVDLNDVVGRTALLISYELRLRGIELERKLDSEAVRVVGDRYELQQVLLNLLTNAVHAVSALPPDRPRRITLATARDGGRATLRVRDTGPGIPPNLVPHVFTPFFTTKGPGQGTGLGLSVSYGLVEAHGGRISYRPPPGGGAEFVVSLPLHIPVPGSTQPAGAIEPMTEALAANPGGTAGNRPTRVLVVDDDPAVHRLVSALFAPEGHVVDTARSGEQALRLVEDSVYDLVITDAHAVSADGRLFAASLLRSHPEWRDRLVVASHGRASEPYVTAAVHWVAKPLNVRDLRSVVGRVLTAVRSER
jgi:two-component system NtrC family sensor kinase